MKKLSFLLILVSTSFIYSQELDSIASMDKDFLDSLPESVRADVMSEMKDRGDSDNLKNLQRRPSTEISKLETIKNWENFKKEQSQINRSERYGINLFNSMQSSFMPLNEPNFGNDYVLDYGDYVNIELFGTQS